MLKGEVLTMVMNKNKIKIFFKKTIAKLLAVVMAFSSLASTGMAISTAHASPTSVNTYGEEFIEELVKITAAGTPYVWGGWQSSGVDCRGFVRLALSRAYGISIMNTVGYLVDEDGNAILNSSGKKIEIDVAAYDSRGTLAPYVGKRICVEGNGVKCYYRVFVADYCYNLNNVLDIKTNGNTYSSLIAYACKFPGSIISHNGHCGVALGEFHSKEEIIAKYPGLNGKCSGTADNGSIVRWSESSYNLGNSYDKDDYRYWFGKTVFLSACSSKSGIRADNFTTSGKSAAPTPDSSIAILLCEGAPKTTTVSFEKIDQATKQKLPGAVYGIYKDAACKKQLLTFTTSTETVDVTIQQGTYYVKEITPPNGYELSNEIVKVNANSGNKINVTLYDKPTHSTVLVRKVDAKDISMPLPGTKLKIQEYNVATETFIDLVDLDYLSTVQAFTINKPYTNSDGVTYNDNSLHYSQSNQGCFKLVEVSAQSGYINEGYEKIFNIKDGALRLVGQNSITNKANLSLLINKVNVDGQPLEGAKMVFDYNGVLYKGITDVNGQLLFENIPEGPTNTGILYESLAPEGYVPTLNYINGQSIALTKDSTQLKNGCFQTSVKVINGTAEVPPVVVSEGTIVISKTDMSRIDDFNVGVPDTYYTIYTDDSLSTIATDLNGNVLSRLKTDANGQIIINNLALGVYYVREVEAPNGYAMQLKTFAINLLSDYADKNGVLSLTTNGVGDPRQTVKIGIQKVDSITNKPIENVVYALYAGSDLLTSTEAKTVASGTLIGYYKTDSDGIINVNSFGTDAFSVNGREFESVTVYDTDNLPISPLDALVNGKYYFVEILSPDGYVLDEKPVEIDAGWRQNNTSEDLIFNDGIIGPAGRLLTMNNVLVKNERQTTKITFNKIDAKTNNNNVNLLYGLENYSAAADNNMAATLGGAVYQLINTSDITDIETGMIIPAETALGTYTTSVDGCFVADKMTLGAYDGHSIPNGTYKLVEIFAPQGYAVNNNVINIDAKWTNEKTKEKQLSCQISDVEHVLMQAITINKLSGTDRQPLAGATFELYSVAEILEKCSITVEQLPWNTASTQYNGYNTISRGDFSELIKNSGVSPVTDENDANSFITDADGLVTTGKFVYGDYILYESVAPNGYVASDAMYIQIPWVEVSVADATYFIHDVDDQPTDPLYQTVINACTNVVVNKYEIVDQSEKRFVVGAKLQVLDKNKNIVLDENGNAIEWTSSDEAHTIQNLPVGVYYLREVKAPFGYQKSDDIQFTVIESEEAVQVEMIDQRTYGTLEINKRDSNTSLPLANVVFNFVSVNEVRDPVTGEIMFKKGQIVDTLITDENGYASISEYVPIGTYDNNGFVSAIQYELIEIEAPVGQYDTSEKYDIKFNYVNDTTPIIKRTLDLANKKPIITVEKTANPETYIGQYENRDKITVVKYGDVIEYKILIQNSGLASAWNIVVKDNIPQNTKFVSMDLNNNGTYDSETNTVYWAIDEVPAGDTVELAFSVMVDNQYACEIDNVAQYAMPNNVPQSENDYLNPMDDENDWMFTNHVIHQTIEFHKGANIKYGSNKSDAPYLDIGSQFTYIITFGTHNDMYDLSVSDVIPKGLSFIPGSATCIMSNGDTIDVSGISVSDDNLLVFPTIDIVSGGRVVFTFDVQVENVKEYDMDYYFINEALASVKNSENVEDNINLTSNPVTHKTMKTNKTNTPVLGYDAANETMLWATVAAISSIAMVVFGIYGFVEKKKK
jgi:uncharacterized repeat protein (TIGR01451 family)